MKIKSVDIQGMHNASVKHYDINKDLTYICGPNGVGKSTILEAIELSILGYIPGYPKTKQSIIQHAENGSSMSVKVTFDDGSSILREYITRKGSVSENLVTEPEDLDISSLVKDVEIPVFNFSQFLGMSANEKKKWFMDFLPSGENEISWKDDMKQLYQELEISQDEYVESKLDEFSSMVDTSSSYSDAFKDVNSKVKEYISFERGNISGLQDTLNNLLHYSEHDIEVCSKDAINSTILEEESEKNQLQLQLNNLHIAEGLKKDLEKYYGLAETFNADENYTSLVDNQWELESKQKELDDYIDIHQEDLNDIVKKKEDLQDKVKEKYKEANQLTSASNDIPKFSHNGCCPYTGNQCQDISEIDEDNEKQYNELQDKLKSVLNDISSMNFEIDRLSEEYNKTSSSLSDMRKNSIQLQNDINDIDKQISNLMDEYSNKQKAYDSYQECIRTFDMDENTSRENIQEEIDKLDVELNKNRDILAKLQANEKYNEMYDKCSKDIMNSNERLEILKSWEKYTGVNGIQNKLANEPFLKLEENITEYLRNMFSNDNISGYFNLENKSNSFDFGIILNDDKVTFNSLSSGEKCMFMISLLTSILESSNNEFKFLCIDDSFDNLDDDNRNSVIEFCKNISDIQFLFAGVKEIDDETSMMKIC